jgi:tetratricopeptide (TPR) repeat protein
MFAAAAIACLTGTALAQGVTDRAKALLREGKAAEAFELLDEAAEHLNDAESAYLHGIAALDSGRAGLAIMAFERALAYDPGFAPARAELVRALVATGETDQARIELARLANVQVPPEVRQKLALLDKELATAVDAAHRRTRGISSYVEAEAGYDSNVNTGANSRTFAIPLFGGATATLNRIFQKHGSAVGGIGVGAMAYNEIQPGLRLFAGADAKARYAFRELEDENYQTVYWSGSAGARWQRNGHTVSGALTVLENRVGNVLFDKQFGVYGQWQMQVNANNEVGVFGQWLDQKHPIQRSLDTQLTLLGASWRHALEGDGLPILTASGYFGDDREQGTDKAVGRQIRGARATYERQLEFGAKLVATGAYQRSEYGGQNVFFNAIREDKRVDLSLGLVFSPAKDVTVTPQYMYTQNRSNIPVVDFSRHQLIVNLRRDFR